MGATTVPLYDTLGAQSTAFILEQTGMSAVVVEAEALVKLLRAVAAVETRGGCGLRFAVVCGGTLEGLKLQNPEDAAEARRLADEQNVRIMTFAEVVEMGRLDRSPLTRPSSEDIYTICYTSGAGSHASEAELLH
eukprot:GHVU01205384.1.p2 GENE.GHVU01205384.1~~GHVU01205384.1.p2  ORF type:complete len:135 (-),score=31.12 GHVU01205384.1:136-540(-)